MFLLTAVSGFAAAIIWFNSNQHSHLGAVHGKIGFLMAIIAIIHLVRNKRKMKINRAYPDSNE